VVVAFRSFQVRGALQSMAQSGNPEHGEVDPADIKVEGWKEMVQGATIDFDNQSRP
jgi:hypothetical protein